MLFYSLLVAKRSQTDTDDRLGFKNVPGLPSEQEENKIMARKRSEVPEMEKMLQYGRKKFVRYDEEQRYIQWVCIPSRIWRRKQEQSTVSSEWYLLIQTLLMSIWRISKRSRSDRELSRRSKVFSKST